MILDKKIAVVLPAYNEELTIQGTIEAFFKFLPESEIYVVNNNSKDQTEKIAIQTMSRLGCKGRVINESRQGKGNAMRRAFHDIEADIYVLADADLTYPAERAVDLIAPVLDGSADMVVGDRQSGGEYKRENKRPLHNFGNRLVLWLVNKLFGANLQDIMSGYRVFSRQFVKSYPILVEGFQIETDMTLHALHKRFRIVEIPVEYKDRPEGSSSKLNTIRDGTKVIFTILQILRYYRPLVFFGSLGLLAGLIGLLTSIPVFDDWFTHRYIYHVPLAVLSAAFEIVAVLFVGIGLILDAISHNQCMEYEKSLFSIK